ncbi:MAG: threonine synthase [Coriobacteriales bacterium]|jgi:threonine synthase|nr:threonine synthase [Coriobacteriales bacterium]
MISYLDTRGGGKTLSFSEAVLQGLAPNGGLYVPERLPKLDWAARPWAGTYAEMATALYDAFETGFDHEQIAERMESAYGRAFDVPDAVALHPISQHTDVLELWHGPTAAFKDMALQCLPRFFVHSDQRLILVATSGDTGSAALAGFADQPGVKVIVLYPDGGVSPTQLAQMTSMPGANLYVCAVRGNFDDCQHAVKQVFSDSVFAQELKDDFQVSFSSANSINWGRLLPQVVYYLFAYARLLGAGRVESGEPVNICVPTGNFGNILAAWYAGQLGLPLKRLICASNSNNVLYDFFHTGSYDITQRTFHLTASPAMDILVSSNLERLLFELNGRDSGLLASWMSDLDGQGCFNVDSATFAKLQAQFASGWVDDQACFATMAKLYREQDYLVDPHTAVALNVMEQLHPDGHSIVASTASWAKFPEDVGRALGERPGAGRVPASLADLAERPRCFRDTIDGDLETIKQMIRGRLKQWI